MTHQHVRLDTVAFASYRAPKQMVYTNTAPLETRRENQPAT